MSKERAVRRAARLAEQDATRAARQRSRRRAELRRATLRRLRPRGPGRRTGRLFPRRSRGQRAAIVTVGLGVLGLTWLVVEPLALRVFITAVVLLTAPALVVVAFDRRI